MKEHDAWYCFILLRPETVSRKLCGVMISQIEELNCEIVLMELQPPNEARIKALYHKKELDNWREEIVQNHLTGNIVALLVRGGENICHEVSIKVAMLREQYAIDEKLNGIHSSDSTEEALQEARIFFPFFKQPG